MGKHTITNISGGPRRLNTETGAVTLRDGETREVELSDAEHKVAKSTEWFGFGAKAAKEAAADEPKDDGKKN